MNRKQKLMLGVLVFGVLAAVIFLLTAGKRQKFKPQAASKENIIAVWTRPDGAKELGVFIRVIDKYVRHDSVNNKDVIAIDTIWAKQYQVTLTDSLGKPILDSLGLPKLDPKFRYIQINKDSINTRVENISIDTLLKN